MLFYSFLIVGTLKRWKLAAVAIMNKIIDAKYFWIDSKTHLTFLDKMFADPRFPFLEVFSLFVTLTDWVLEAD